MAKSQKDKKKNSQASGILIKRMLKNIVKDPLYYKAQSFIIDLKIISRNGAQRDKYQPKTHTHKKKNQGHYH